MQAILLLFVVTACRGLVHTLPRPQHTRLKSHFHHQSQSFLSSLSILTTTLSIALSPLPANANNYASMSAPTKKIAEAWRTIDNTFVDRTFNNKDWFKIREDALSSSLKYKTIDEAYDQIDQMTSLLGDKYTRLLRPTEYKTLVDAATSKSVVAGVGIEIGKPTPTSNSRPTINDLEQNAPAFKSGLKKGDVFSSINSVSIPPCDESNFCMTSLASNLRGDVNTDVTVEIIRGSGDKQQSQSFTLTRQQFAVTTVSERSERAFWMSRSMKCAKWIQKFTSTTKLNPIRLWLARFAFLSLKMRTYRFARRRFAPTSPNRTAALVS